ncbi:MAG: prepilin-type N-terminal cleavage/methylation domain-containing protein [Planctomycetaceae bacterium]|nr:prepilin-type N-terminal cleavage/methylation domain-containing protein [Planctomycetaceae bacterium]
MKSVVSKPVRRRSGFTLAEVAAAIVLLGLLVGSSLTLINRYIDTVMDMRLRDQAFEIAHSNMERLLSENSLSDMDDYGTDEFNPDMDWETIVEPFFEPVTNQMWIRAVCTAGFTDTKGERQDVELEHWITNLTPEQVKQIKAQQKAEQEFMDLLQGGELSDMQKATVAFMLQEGMDVEAYHKFLKQQLRDKLEYLSSKGFEGYEGFEQQLADEEDLFLQDKGLDFNKYNEFVQTFDPLTFDPTQFELNPKAQRDTEGSEFGPEETKDPMQLLPPDILQQMQGPARE